MLMWIKLGQAQWLQSIILATQKAEIGRIMVQGQSGQMLTRPYLTQWLGKEVYTYHPGYTGKHK
jgi:hypothetical protein